MTFVTHLLVGRLLILRNIVFPLTKLTDGEKTIPLALIISSLEKTLKDEKYCPRINI